MIRGSGGEGQTYQGDYMRGEESCVLRWPGMVSRWMH